MHHTHTHTTMTAYCKVLKAIQTFPCLVTVARLQLIKVQYNSSEAFQIAHHTKWHFCALLTTEFGVYISSSSEMYTLHVLLIA